eukprot:CAMPEP_0194216546 /NCGR_PEP_ID=MMETSP0156-20130528/19209_1 /TAXON_ID=33649 /ORGANISM="Thalassionema nitzschioides, Strain L26-B" /LENGTH=728 /DNA_ID=CAMNT_0038945339 /DNA_START=43 /DNA_END=2226 /DNA_ORIENTATION=+
MPSKKTVAMKQHRNRLFLAAGNVVGGCFCLTILHRWIANQAIAVPNYNILRFKETINNVSQYYSDSVEQESNIIRESILQNSQEETDRVSLVLEANDAIVQRQLVNEKGSKDTRNSFFMYLQAWSQVGNEVPFRENVTDEQKLILQKTYSFDNDQTLKDLSDGVASLDKQLMEVAKYNRDYAMNKTGLSSLYLQMIDNVPDLPPVDTKFIVDMRDLILSYIAERREEIESFFARVLEQLEKTEISFDDIALKYDGLRELYLDVYNIIQGIESIGIDIPFLENDFAFPSSFYKVPGMDFPDISIFLEPIDDLVIFIKNCFRSLEVDYLDNFNATLNIQLNAKFGPLRMALGAWKPEDYGPPAMRNPYNSRKVTLEAAEALKEELLSNITSLRNAIVKPTMDEDGVLNTPVIDGFTHSTIEFGNPDFGIFSWWIQLFNWLINTMKSCQVWWNIVQVVFDCIWFYFVVVQKAFEKHNETKTHQPTVDLRIEEEREDEVETNPNNNEKKRPGKFDIFLRAISYFLSHPTMKLYVCRVVAIVSLLGTGYFLKGHYNPGYLSDCVKSNPIETQAVENFLHIFAFTAGSENMMQLMKENQLEIQRQCGNGERFAYLQYQEQVRNFETSKKQTKFFLKEIQEAESIVDLNLLCEQQKEACNNSSDTLMACPTFEDGSIITDPCDMLFGVRTENEPLALADYKCGVLGSGSMNTKDMQKNALQHLDLEGEYCIIKLW